MPRQTHPATPPTGRGTLLDLLAAARALAPRIEAAADQIEHDRALPRDLVDALIDAGLFRMVLPCSLGGLELDLPTYVRVIEEVARADASVAWCLGQANGLCNYVTYAEPSVALAVFAGGRTILANGPGEGNRPGRAVPDASSGGYRITGKWMFASGFPHATWLLAICNVTSESGEDASRLMLVPKDRVTVHDAWHVSGLRGTGSQSFSLEEELVPFERAIRVAPATQRESGPLGAFNNNGFFGPAFGSVALGIAHASLAAIVDFAAGKVPRGTDRSIRESATVQLSIAQAHARLAAARGYLHDTLISVWDSAVTTGAVTLDQRVALRLAATHATHEAAAVVDTAYTLAGSNAIFENRPFERRFRDVHAVTQQVQARRA
ncbi:MAG: acyl-CoA dehydrogenase family protein, partial [Chloroflexi bacterium]|nr:acyl-CoA dehydrogenase family protein [Chloroflexota bacterium]